MKHVLICCILVIVSFACKKDATTAPQAIPATVFQIHLQGWFSKTPVNVYIDQSQVFADTISTGYIIAVAAIIPVQINQGVHTLGVTIPNSVSKDTSFTISDSLYTGVNYNLEKAMISYHFQRKPFVYR
jgi:hypothetical protein